MKLFGARRAKVSARAVWNGAVLAETADAVVVEGNPYFPPEDVDWSLLEPSDRKTVCPWKGEASYYSVIAGGRRNENAAWYYPYPSRAAAEIKERVAFWHGVTIDAEGGPR